MNTFHKNILWTERSCLLIFYLQTTVNCQFIYALCIVSLNRLFAIVYQSKTFFRTKKWTIICISIQWICGILIPLPQFASSLTQCFKSGLEMNYQIYVLFINGILPAIFLAITNSIIFKFVRRSTRRVLPMNNEHQTPATSLNHRDARLLKHMLFMFAAFFCGWIPVYIMSVIYWDGKGISNVAYHGVLMLPIVGLVIDIVELFLYNHELRTYFIAKVRSYRR
ncbi:unnamed protein product [Adineta steineri]|uniref:G-protein coupled receptors family 1 profile domain-containing protein n=2 Tax=Adineta steineri TaxID=433720 RepID=A0A814ZZR0_9BILA|nr:unnamed protein product [Adineta steineri]